MIVGIRKVVRIFRRDEQMKGNEPALRRCHVQSEFDVRKDKLHRPQSDVLLVRHDLLIGFRDVVVGNRDGFDGERRRFKGRQVVWPRCLPRELIVNRRTRRMNMRLPPVLFRSSADHVYHCYSSFFMWELTTA